MDAGKDQKKKIDVLEAMYYTVSAWWQVTQQTLEYCFRKAGYGLGQHSDVSDIAMRNEDDDDAFHVWQKFSGMDNEKFDDYVAVDSHLVTSSIYMVKELCESHMGTMSVEGEEEEGKIANPNPKLCRIFLKRMKRS
jgi:hypothetical protein